MADTSEADLLNKPGGESPDGKTLNSSSEVDQNISSSEFGRTEEIDTNLSEKQEIPVFAGFSLASGKPAPKLSPESMKKAASLLGTSVISASTEKPSFDSSLTEPPLSTGFSLASGKPAPKLSPESMKKAASLLGSSETVFASDLAEDSVSESEPKAFAGFSLASGKPAPKLSPESMKKAASLLGTSETLQGAEISHPVSEVSGFSFASGKSAPKLSEEALKKASAILDMPKAEASSPTLKQIPMPSDAALKLATSTFKQDQISRLEIQTPSPSLPRPAAIRPAANSPSIKTRVFKSPRPTGKPLLEVAPRPQRIQSKTLFTYPLESKTRLTLLQFSDFHGLPDVSKPQPINLRVDDMSASDAFVELLEKGADPLLTKPSAIKRHFFSIVWKLQALQITLEASPIAPTRQNIISELLFRLQTELINGKRSCLRIVYNRDTSASIQMILYVSSIQSEMKIRLSDGWYEINAEVDSHLQKLVRESKIYVGQKLRICNAVIEGEACEPFESEAENVVLKLRINSVRRAKWDSTLGFQKEALFAVSIASLYPNGGPVPFIEAVIQKKSPLMFRIAETGEVRSYDQHQKWKNDMEHLLSEGGKMPEIEIIPFFSLKITDLCPGYPSDTDVTFWRFSEEGYDEVTEGKCVRIYSIETGEGLRLRNRNQSKIETIEEPPHIRLVKRERKCLSSLHEIDLLWSLGADMNTEVDIVAAVVGIESGFIFLADQSSVLASISPRETINLSLGQIVCIENARIGYFDEVTRVASLNTIDFTRISKTIPKKYMDGYYRLKELGILEEAMKAASNLGQPGFTGQVPRVGETDIGFLGSIELDTCEKVSIEKVNEDTTVAILGDFFNNSQWKESFLEKHFKDTPGFHILMPVLQGMKRLYVIVNQLEMSSFFSAIALNFSLSDRELVSQFFDRFFEGSETDELMNLRSRVRKRFQLQSAPPETLIRVILAHAQIIYDEDFTKSDLSSKSGIPNFPFFPEEWIQFCGILNRVLIKVRLSGKITKVDDTSRHLCYLTDIRVRKVEDETRLLMSEFTKSSGLYL